MSRHNYMITSSLKLILQDEPPEARARAAFTQAGCNFMPTVLLAHLHNKETP